VGWNLSLTNRQTQGISELRASPATETVGGK
jgi:hypothetical protein